MVRAVSRVFAAVAAGLAVFLLLLLTRYFLPPHIPRFRVETFFMWFLGAGVLAVASRRGQSRVRAGSDPTLTPGLERWHYAAICGLFTAIVLLQYWPSLRVGWLSDDFVLADWAARREWIHARETGFVRPIVPMLWAILSFAPVTWSWPATLHGVNLLLHALNGVLVVAIAERLRLDRQTALGAGIIFLTFSAMTEALVWVSGMQDVLMATLTLVAVVGTIGVRRGSDPIAIAAAALALGVKETAVAIPLLAWAVAWASPEGIGRGDRRRTLTVMTAVAVLYAIVRAFWGVSLGYGQSVSRYFFKQLAVDPFATLGQPWSAAWLQAHPFVALSRGALVVVLLGVAFVIWQRDGRFRIAGAGAAWVLLAVLPVFSLFHVSETLEGSRYLYLPAVGFALLVAAVMGDLVRRVPARGVASGLMAAGVLAFTAPSLAASRAELARWIEAARLRDDVLITYIRVMPSLACASFVAEGLVDNVDGAYVLRNGFHEALREMGAELPAAASGPRCDVSWTDHLIIRQEP